MQEVFILPCQLCLALFCFSSFFLALHDMPVNTIIISFYFKVLLNERQEVEISGLLDCHEGHYHNM